MVCCLVRPSLIDGSRGRAQNRTRCRSILIVRSLVLPTVPEPDLQLLLEMQLEVARVWFLDCTRRRARPRLQERDKTRGF